MSQNIDYSKGIYDARQLGAGRMLILGVQHMFAMFGATVLVPLLTGLSVSTTLLCAGLGTLLFHFITKGKVPAFLGSSFAYLGGFSIVAPMLADADGNLTIANTQMLPYACAGVAFSGLVYLAVSLLISTFGIRRIMRFFPPVVTGPIIIAIGLILAPSAISNCQANWLLAFVALGTVIVCNIWGKGMVKILPILIGVLVSYAVALVTGAVDFERIASAAWFGIPLHKEAMGLFAIDGSPEFISALFTIIPIALATMMEHVGDIAAISATVGHNYTVHAKESMISFATLLSLAKKRFTRVNKDNDKHKRGTHKCPYVEELHDILSYSLFPKTFFNSNNCLLELFLP